MQSVSHLCGLSSASVYPSTLSVHPSVCVCVCDSSAYDSSSETYRELMIHLFVFSFLSSRLCCGVIKVLAWARFFFFLLFFSSSKQKSFQPRSVRSSPQFALPRRILASTCIFSASSCASFHLWNLALRSAWPFGASKNVGFFHLTTIFFYQELWLSSHIWVTFTFFFKNDSLSISSFGQAHR